MPLLVKGATSPATIGSIGIIVRFCNRLVPLVTITVASAWSSSRTTFATRVRPVWSTSQQWGAAFLSAASLTSQRMSSTENKKRGDSTSQANEQNNAHDEIDTEEREQITPTWCPEQQIYIGGVVPDNNADVTSLLSSNNGSLRIFGYGSLCWNPGSGATLSRQDEGVTRTLGRAKGWKRCWAQRSADHRGTPSFPGLVCTLLSDDEVRQIRHGAKVMCASKKYVSDEGVIVIDEKQHTHDEKDQPPSMTEGVIYTVPPPLVKDCLSELDFREKGGYARDIIDVVEDETGKTVKALLYRGTPENPAFWLRSLLDLPFAAAIMAVSVGPSGHNDAYLYNLDQFLSDAAMASPAAAAAFDDHTGDEITRELASMARVLQRHVLYFVFGSGSNQHNQLLLASETSAACLTNGDEAHELKEIVLVVPPPRKSSSSSSSLSEDLSPLKPKKLFAGGGHSGLLTEGGNLYLWGWNEHGQLGRRHHDSATEAPDGEDGPSPLPVIEPLQSGNMKIEHAALGHTHTLVIEQNTGRLYAFGDNGRGQVTSEMNGAEIVIRPTTPSCLVGERFIDIAAGLFHSAAITSDGKLVTFGCGRFGQRLSKGFDSETKEKSEEKSGAPMGRWRPDDGSRLVRVVCGRRHTMVLDEYGRVWSIGDNKYGQLGRRDEGRSEPAKDGMNSIPKLVEGCLGENESGCFDICSGWSHAVALVRDKETGETMVYGWGRNDKGQLGTGSTTNVPTPQPLYKRDGVQAIRSICCGAESTMILDESGTIWGCGWNEHGNLSIGRPVDVSVLTPIKGARVTAPPTAEANGDKVMAAGGAHFLTMMV